MAKPKEQIPFIMLGDKNSGTPLYRQIYELIRRAILSGEFSPRMQLLSTRALASQLGVSRITVVNAYEQLFSEGYLEGKIGAGTFVAAELPDDLLQSDVKKSMNLAKPTSSLPLRLSLFGQRRLSINKSFRICGLNWFLSQTIRARLSEIGFDLLFRPKTFKVDFSYLYAFHKVYR